MSQQKLAPVGTDKDGAPATEHDARRRHGAAGEGVPKVPDVARASRCPPRSSPTVRGVVSSRRLGIRPAVGTAEWWGTVRCRS